MATLDPRHLATVTADDAPATAAEAIRRRGTRLKGKVLLQMGFVPEAQELHPTDPIVAVTGGKNRNSRLYAPASWLKMGGARP
jgi:hypothetical protein